MRVFRIYEVEIAGDEKSVSIFVPSRWLAEKLADALVSDIREHPGDW